MEEERQYQPVQQFNPGPQYDPGPNRFTFFAGVIMPTISITVEATTHICADTFFDPLPTIWHLLLVIFVPLAQLQVWFAIRKGTADRLRLAGFLNVVTIGISIFYSIVYLPLIPLAMVALLFGLGLLPLAPFFSLLASVIMRHQLKRVAATTPRRSFALKARGLLAGLALTAAVIGMAELPATLTTIGLYMATSSSSQTRSEGIRFLRKYGNKDALMRSCMDRTGWATDLIGSALNIENPITPAEAQKIYYRVTGEIFDASIPPGRAGINFVTRDTIDFDQNQGGERVGGGKLVGLSLASSKLDGTMDADGGVGYMEWTLVFRNDSDVQREARAEVQLPPRGVVSRLTLWVNGEEREAAFAGRGQVREAYQKVAIQQQRDPVLVTTAGRDLVLVQCFPVPPNKGEMKIRFGITLPLVLEDATHAKLLMPHFVFRNFSIPESFKHTVGIQAKTAMWPTNEVFLSSREQDVFSVAGTIGDNKLADSSSAITLDRMDVKEMWSNDPFNPGFAVSQSVTEQTPAHLQRIVLVVDSSATMRNHISEIQRAIATLPSGFDVKLVLADDEASSESITFTDANGQNMGANFQTLNYAAFDGGADNVPALLKAWDLAATKAGHNAIVWIHSPQGLLLSPPNELKQRWARPYGPTLYSVQTSSGSDQIEKQLDGIEEVKTVARTGLLTNDLEKLFAQLTGRAKTLQLVRSNEKIDKHTTLSGGNKTADHLARLWANDQVARILALQDEDLTDEATALAVRYQLVTPVSGAVVLETAEQYRASGLEPVNAGTVPTIPEPEMVVLLNAAGAILILFLYMKYRKHGRGSCTV